MCVPVLLHSVITQETNSRAKNIMSKGVENITTKDAFSTNSSSSCFCMGDANSRIKTSACSITLCGCEINKPHARKQVNHFVLVTCTTARVPNFTLCEKDLYMFNKCITRAHDLYFLEANI